MRCSSGYVEIQKIGRIKAMQLSKKNGRHVSTDVCACVV